MQGGLGSVDVEEVREALLTWYEADHRSFPWRETDDPYAILVSEVMSQQTQLDRIVDAWEAFLDRWPTPEALATADRSDVVAFWSDHRLGYNNRARYLHEAAEQIQTEFDGQFPREPAELEELMGVGPYTATAVASFAFGTGGAVVDTNVKRVLYRAFEVPDDGAAFRSAADELVPSGTPGTWNNAIMELGGVACMKRPDCDGTNCPWREWCHAYRSGDFTAPDVQTQPSFEGSRRQFRGRIVRTLADEDELLLADLGPKIRVDYTPTGEAGQDWLRGLLADLESEGLVTVSETGDTTTVSLKQ